MPLIQSIPSVGPAVDPEVVKRHLGIEHGADDETVNELIEAATQLIEDECSIQLLDAVWTLKLDSFPCGDEAIELGRPRVTSIEEVSYVNVAGITGLLTDCQFDGDSVPARLAPAVGSCWPATMRGVLNPVAIRFRTGASSVEEVSPTARKLIIHLCSLWFEGRVPLGSAPPIDPFYRRQLDLLRWC